MADEINVQFDAPGPPRDLLDQWRTLPPKALTDDGYELVDESFNSLTFERRYLDWPAKLLYITIVGYFLRHFMESVFRITARFDEQGANTRILLLGTAHPKTQAALRELIAEHGGATGPPTPSMASTLLPGSPSS